MMADGNSLSYWETRGTKPHWVNLEVCSAVLMRVHSLARTRIHVITCVAPAGCLYNCSNIHLQAVSVHVHACAHLCLLLPADCSLAVCLVAIVWSGRDCHHDAPRAGYRWGKGRSCDSLNRWCVCSANRFRDLLLLLWWWWW